MNEHPSAEKLQHWHDGLLTRSESEDVEAHLEMCYDVCQPLLDGLLERSTASEVPDAPDPDVAALASFSHYRVLGVISRGGMGIILRCRDCILDRELAIKVPRRKYVNLPGFLERFKVEAQIASRLMHPGIAPVHELGTLPDGLPYFTMKLIGGRDLAALLHERPSPAHDLPRFLTIFQQICQTVAYAQSKNVLHRDLKPANVRVGEFGEVQVLDWGLSKEISADVDNLAAPLSRDKGEQGQPPSTVGEMQQLRGSGLRAHSHEGEVRGTLDYMPPEQAQGEVRRMDKRCDVFSLGAILSEILTGKPPYVGSTQSSLWEQARKAQLSPAFARLDASGADAELVELAKKCLAAGLDDRPSDAGVVAEAITAYSNGVEERKRKAEIAQARAESKVAEERKRRRWQLGLATTVLVALALLGTGATLYLQDRATRAQELARIEEQRSFASRLQYGAQVKLAQNQWERTRMDEALRLLNELRPEGSAEDFRGLEWYFLHRLCQGGVRTLTSDAGDVNQVAFSADGKWLAAISKGAFGIAKPQMWDTATGRENQVFREDTGGNRLAFSPDGACVLLAIGPVIRIVGLAAEQETGALRGHTLFVSGLTFSKDGKTVASAGTDKTVRIWDLASGTQLHQYPLRSGLRPRVALSPVARRLAVWDIDDEVARILDVASGEERYTVGGKNHKVLGLAFHPDGQLLATGGEDRTVRLWNAADGRPIHSFQEPTQKVLDVAFNPNGGLLACCTGDPDRAELPGEVLVWDTATRRLEQSHRGHAGLVASVAFSPDGKRLASGSSDESIHIWNARSNEGIRSLEKHTGPVHAVAFSPHGEHLASAGEDRVIRVFDVSTTRQLLVIPNSDEYISGLAYSPNGELLAAGGRSQKLKLWTARTGEPVAEWPASRGRVTCLAFSPDSRWLASASIDGTINLRATDRDAESHSLAGHKGAVYSVAFSTDGKILASAGEDKEVVLWHVETREPMARLAGHTDVVYAVCFSPDGQRLASASADSTVRVWDIADSKVVFTLRGQEEPLFSLAYSFDGQRLASAGADRIVRIWDARTGQELLRLTGHAKAIRSICFHPTSRLLASASEDHMVRIWDGSDKLEGDRP